MFKNHKCYNWIWLTRHLYDKKRKYPNCFKSVDLLMWFTKCCLNYLCFTIFKDFSSQINMVWLSNLPGKIHNLFNLWNFLWLANWSGYLSPSVKGLYKYICPLHFSLLINKIQGVEQESWYINSHLNGIWSLVSWACCKLWLADSLIKLLLL
jgi:hypothetical protein